MSSPPAVDYPSDDVEMGEESETLQGNGQSVPSAPPLFYAATPSPVSTPRMSRAAQPQSSPLVQGITARRALGMSTPKRPPLFAPSPAASSSPMRLPTSSPTRTPRRQGSALGSDLPRQDSDILDFPSSPMPVRAPKNHRGDIHSTLSLTPTATPRRRRQRAPSFGDVNMNSDGTVMDMPASTRTLSAAAEPEEDEPDELRAIWGTDVNIIDTMASFRDFLSGFKPKYRAAHDRSRGLPSKMFNTPEEGELVLYDNYLRRMRKTGETVLNLDVVNLLAYPRSAKLYYQLQKYPQELIPAFDTVLKNAMLELAQADMEGMQMGADEITEDDIAEIMGAIYKVRPFGLETVNMRELNPQDTDKLVSIKGLVIRATPVIPDMKVAFFRCLACLHTVQVEIDRGKITEPARCPRDVCSSPGNMNIIHNRCEFSDRQVIRLQETPDAVPDGQTPHTVSLSVYDELVDVTKPGDRVTVVGIFRSVPVRVNPRQRAIKSLFKTYLDVVHISMLSSGSLALDRSTRSATDRIPGVGGEEYIYADGGDDEFNVDDGRNTKRAEMEAQIKQLAEREDIYTLLSNSLAPSIWQLEDVKKGILLQLFGGTNKSVARGGGGGGPRYRGDVNVLLVGDPGTSKSQIMQYVHKIAPRGVYTSGKGSSAVGLTAYVTRDPDSKQLVLESGALVLSDGGVCCIDEFDKMSDATRSVLHEVMEQQTVSIAKAGIITTLNARTSILAAANPVGSKYDPDLPITRNIDLPPTLISRFDLLYLVLDQVDEALDRQLAEHLVGLYLHDDGGVARDHEVLSLETISNYIEYARNHIQPIINEEAGAELVRCYVEMRNLGKDPKKSSSSASSSENRITATTRQLESMIRLSEAHARMRLSKEVEMEDVKEAYRLMREAIRTSAMDPATGKIDMGLLNTGTGSGQRRMREDMRRELLNMLNSGGNKGMRWADALRNLGEQSTVKIDPAEFGEVVKLMENEGVVKVSGERERRVIKKMEGF